MEKSPVSVIIPAYNEERNIGDCLRSVAWADDVWVVDGGSTDRTREIASSLTPNILQTDNNLAEFQRLKVMDRIRNRWFLFLDADERVGEGLRRSIEEAVRAPEPKAAYAVLRRNLYRGKPIHLHHPDYQMRLFRKDALVSLPEKIHREPVVNGPVGRLEGELAHHFFTNVQDYLKKLNTYSTAEASYWSGRQVSGGRLFYWLALRPAARFFQYYVLRKGFLDGYFGLFYSVSSAYYEWAVASRFLVDSRTPTGARNAS
ncbi:MAG TPA: glycosyltransferase family 2 protein [Candidatus Eisenbacteria bacterium]|nr:glycosyltransferase family 2 protein [Candidatus Eisenbacteria bacterium]